MNRRERVELTLNDDNFVAGMRRAAETATVLRREIELRNATWEPHDWSDFD